MRHNYREDHHSLRTDMAAERACCTASVLLLLLLLLCNVQRPCPKQQPVPRTHRPKPDEPPAVKVGVHQPGRCIARLQRFTLRVRVGSRQRS